MDDLFKTMTLEGQAGPQTLMEVPISGPEGPIRLNDQDLILHIYPAESPAVQAQARALALLTPEGGGQAAVPENFEDALALEKDLYGREVTLLSHLIAHWSLATPAYSPAAFQALLARFPALFDPIRSQVLGAYETSGN